jgi:hypothetical protein
MLDISSYYFILRRYTLSFFFPLKVIMILFIKARETFTHDILNLEKIKYERELGWYLAHWRAFVLSHGTEVGGLLSHEPRAVAVSNLLIQKVLQRCIKHLYALQHYLYYYNVFTIAKTRFNHVYFINFLCNSSAIQL